VVLFPDAPTQRGARHLRELAEAVQEGYEAYVFFVIQMEKCLYFTPNAETDPVLQPP
jgi:DNA-binding sugar fermentation-stimulating protein